MIEYRRFKNGDVPHIVELWNIAQWGIGGVTELGCDGFDLLVLAEPYFDREGFIEAWETSGERGPELVGFVHAGFGPNVEGTGLDFGVGIICAIVVDPQFRRRGIGTELIRRAEQYLYGQGAKALVLGESLERNPFYLGLYGGSDSAGVMLHERRLADPFFEKLGYIHSESYSLLSRELQGTNPPFDPRNVALKRQLKFTILDRPPNATWWWLVRHGRFESLTFTLCPFAGGCVPALVTCWGMDMHGLSRQNRVVGITDLFVATSVRRKGYAKVLLCEVLRRLRDDGVSHVEVVVPSNNTPAIALFEGLGFDQFDQGIVYRKANGPEIEKMLTSETVDLPAISVKGTKEPEPDPEPSQSETVTLGSSTLVLDADAAELDRRSSEGS